MAVSRLGAGAGGNSTGAAVTFNGPNLASSDANTYMVVGVNISVSSNSTATTCAVTCGGVAMTQLGLTLGGSSSNRAAVGLYYLANPGTGIKSIVVTPGGASTKARVACQAVAFADVGSVGAAQTAAATTHAVTSATDGYAVRVLSNGAVLSSPNQTSEYLNGATVSGVGDYFLMQSAAGAASVSFTSSGTATTPLSIGVSLGPVYPQISTLTDDFATKDTAKWTWNGTTSVVSGQANLPCNEKTTGTFLAADYNENIISTGVFALTDSAVYINVLGVADPSFNSNCHFRLVSAANSGNVLDFDKFNADLYWTEISNSATTGQASVAFNATTHAWWRLRNVGGNGGTNYWETSSAGTSWSVFTSRTAPFDVGAMQVKLACGYQSPNGATLGTFIVDNLNTTGTPAVSLIPPIRRPNYGSLLHF